MKSEKISNEIAALQRKQKETKNAVAKKALTAKIQRLKKELDDITTAAQAKTALAKAQSKIREMSQKDFNEFIKKLATKPEYSFLKGMSKGKIKDDIMRVAKPVGWRFRGRENTKKPTKKDIKEGNNVYYEGRTNRSDVSRTIRLAEGGGVGDIELLKNKIRSRSKKMKIYGESGYGGYVVYLDGNKVDISNYTDLTPYSAQATDSEITVSFNAPNKSMIIFSDKVDKRFEDNKSFEKYGGIKYIYEPLTNKSASEIYNKLLWEKYAEGGGVGDFKKGDKVTDGRGRVGIVKEVQVNGNLYIQWISYSGEPTREMTADNDPNDFEKFAKGGGVESSEPHRLHMNDMMAKGGGVKGFKYEIFAENTKTGEKTTVAHVKAYGDVPKMITGLKMGVVSSPIKYGFKEIK